MAAPLRTSLNNVSIAVRSDLDIRTKLYDCFDRRRRWSMWSLQKELILPQIVLRKMLNELCKFEKGFYLLKDEYASYLSQDEEEEEEEEDIGSRTTSMSTSSSDCGEDITESELEELNYFLKGIEFIEEEPGTTNKILRIQ